jgi:hypothetical protein
LHRISARRPGTIVFAYVKRHGRADLAPDVASLQANARRKDPPEAAAFLLSAEEANGFTIDFPEPFSIQPKDERAVPERLLSLELAAGAGEAEARSLVRILAWPDGDALAIGP